MRRTIPLLSGLAILVVLLNHVTWHILRDYTPGLAHLLPALPYIVIDNLGKFAVPAFVFTAGYFISYTTSEGRHPLKWSVVQARLLGLLWPWLIWTTIFTLAQVATDRELTFRLVLENLFIQYYFVPLLLEYYLLSVIVVPLAKTHLKQLLWGAAILQLALIGVFYARIYWPGFPPEWFPYIDLGPVRDLRYVFFFPLGVAAGMRLRDLRAWLSWLKPVMPYLILFFFILQTAEAIAAFSMGPQYYPIGADQSRLSSALFALAVLLTFALNERVNLPLSKFISSASTRTFGYYLSHYLVLAIMDRVLVSVVPWLTDIDWLQLPVLYVGLVAIITGILELARRLPVKQYYRYVFG